MLKVSQINTYIKVRFQFAALHCWPDAPDEVGYLRHPHRHVFHVTATVEVFHDDRDLEFILVKRYLQDQVDKVLKNKEWPGRASCEYMATKIAQMIRQKYGCDRLVCVEVSEDGENGALVEWTADSDVEEG